MGICCLIIIYKSLLTHQINKINSVLQYFQFASSVVTSFSYVLSLIHILLEFSCPVFWWVDTMDILLCLFRKLSFLKNIFCNKKMQISNVHPLHFLCKFTNEQFTNTAIRYKIPVTYFCLNQVIFRLLHISVCFNVTAWRWLDLS